jgi:hypothetical protein
MGVGVGVGTRIEISGESVGIGLGEGVGVGREADLPCREVGVAKAGRKEARGLGSAGLLKSAQAAKKKHRPGSNSNKRLMGKEFFSHGNYGRHGGAWFSN